MDTRTLYIVDGHSQVFKAYHAIRQLSTSMGIPTNAVFGFCQILHKLLRTRSPEYIVVAFDSRGPTFRHQIYPEYKANRPAPPEDFEQQLELIQQVLEGLRIPALSMPGFEADDIIATVTARAREAGMNVVIVTADKDLMQLVGDGVKLLRLDTDSEVEFDRESVYAKMGVYPEQIADMLAMVGDSSDNVPGIKSIGPKTAAALLQKYGTLDAILENTADLKGKQRENIEAGRASARLSRRLVELCYDVPLEFKIESFARREPDRAALASLYRKLEFRRFLEEVEPKPAPRDTRYRVVTTPEEMDAFAAQARAEGGFAFDTETDSLSAIEGEVIGISLSCRPGEAIYIPIRHATTLADSASQPGIDVVFEHLGPLFGDPSVRKVAHNAKFDIKMLDKYGFILDGLDFDTLLASYLLNPDRRGHGLKDLAGDLLGIAMQPIQALIGSGRGQLTFDQVDIHQAAQYACADADCTLQLRRLLEPRLDESGMRPLFDEIEMPLVRVLMDMELCGVRIDPAYFARLGQEMREEMDRLATRIYSLVGRSFNIASPRQVGEVLFGDLKLPVVKQKKTGQSTDVEVLEQLTSLHEVPSLILEHRQYEKLKTTYVDVLPGLVSRVTGRIHTTYNQAVAATGRLSSSDPNLQNIPVRTALGRRIRKGFVPLEDGHLLLSADYSQIELRVLAHMTGDPALVAAFRNDEDVHGLTASQVFGVERSAVTPEMRDRAKVINFGIIYGMSAHGLSTRLKIPLEEARRFIEGYFSAYAGVKDWIDKTLADARRMGYVSTLAGRRRYLADINSTNFNARSAAERAAVNAPIQGTSADMIKIAMVRIHRWLRDSDLRTRMIMQVHDELIFDVPEAEMETVRPEVIRLMQEALPLEVPVKVEWAAGRDWSEC
ncbi:MAG: DNA polymerase I [Candidatus Sumerlaeaceae bacterium]|nr:DNA polymerase I [Candidatus Sumerlaeaceae bacterium]